MMFSHDPTQRRVRGMPLIFSQLVVERRSKCSARESSVGEFILHKPNQIQDEILWN